MIEQGKYYQIKFPRNGRKSSWWIVYETSDDAGIAGIPVVTCPLEQRPNVPAYVTNLVGAELHYLDDTSCFMVVEVRHTLVQLVKVIGMSTGWIIYNEGVPWIKSSLKEIQDNA